jgi:hypothetical protein
MVILTLTSDLYAERCSFSTTFKLSVEPEDVGERTTLLDCIVNDQFLLLGEIYWSSSACWIN